MDRLSAPGISELARRQPSAKDDAHQVGGIFGRELIHDARAVNFDGARRNAEIAPGFLVGSAACDLHQDLALACGEPLVAGKYPRQQAVIAVILPPGFDSRADADGYRRRIERLSTKSCAPPRIAITAVGMSRWLDMTKTGAG